MARPDEITVCITRNVKPGCEADSERALHDFVQRPLLLPGQHGWLHPNERKTFS